MDRFQDDAAEAHAIATPPNAPLISYTAMAGQAARIVRPRRDHKEASGSNPHSRS